MLFMEVTQTINTCIATMSFNGDISNLLISRSKKFDLLT